MGERQALITEWLAEYESLRESETGSFAAEHEHNHEIASTVQHWLCGDDDSGICELICPTPDQEDIVLLEKVCVQLLSFYRSQEIGLQRFCLQLVPTLIYAYLTLVSQADKRRCRCIETLLIGVYNYEVVDDAGKPKTVSFRLPSLAQASIYHEPLSIAPQFLTESSLRRWEQCDTKLVSWGPLPQVETLNAQNRLKVMASLLFVYNRNLSLLPKEALEYFCIASSRLVTQGFPSKTSPALAKRRRIPASGPLLLELAHGVYFAMFNGYYSLATRTLADVDRRARYELLPEVMLVTGAVIHSIETNPSGQPCDEPMGISVALSPATTTVTVSKSMITNASFRTKKLPDDIPIQAGAAVPSDSTDALTAIAEEADGDAQRNTVARLSKHRLPGLAKKAKEAVRAAPTKNGAEKRVALRTSRSSVDGGGGSPVPLKQLSELTIEAERNGSVSVDTTDSPGASLDGSERSHMTGDSLELETPRLAPMQVSSV